MFINQNRKSIYVMSPRFFCSIAFQNEIDYKVGGKGKKKVRDDDDKEKMTIIYMNKLTPGLIKQNSKKVIDYLNSIGCYINPIGKIIVENLNN